MTKSAIATLARAQDLSCTWGSIRALLLCRDLQMPYHVQSATTAHVREGHG
eukprot:CAMPEP_0182901612 /NCGR_PEP_ID=MMETSP0034_2-20130328/29795_1 /TAXON_ID=156128 /ORGANISM="Nephroselmis pyriformis, Strain CCMP717" /LENGTH=50 /DNA_ID=CAMNT_0025036071 /DNA_START=81 /DNA_END=229 /DNA_ORIENTATION=-